MPRRFRFRSGDRVGVQINGTMEEPAAFIELVSTTAAAVFVKPSEHGDDDGVRTVALVQLKPFHELESERRRRREYVLRAYKQGVRVFRVDRPDGELFYVDMLDAVCGKAVGHKFKRTTLRNVALCDLYPNVTEE